MVLYKTFIRMFIITIILAIVIILEVGHHFSNVPFVLNINVSPDFERSAGFRTFGWISNVRSEIRSFFPEIPTTTDFLQMSRFVDYQLFTGF